MRHLLDIPQPRLARLEHGLSSSERKARWKTWREEGFDGIEVNTYGEAFGPIWPMRKTHSLDFVADFPGLKALAVGVSALKSLDPLSLAADSLEWLVLGVDPSKLSCRPIADCRKLQSLRFGGVSRDLEAIQSLHTLKALELYGFTFKSLDLVRPLKSLERLWICSGCLTDIGPIRELQKLKAVGFMMVRKLEDLSPLAALRPLQFFSLERMKQVMTMPDCSQLQALRRVYLDQMNGIIDLGGLASAPKLEELIVVGSKIESHVFDSIIAYPKLKRVTVGLASRTAMKEVNAKLGARAVNLFGTADEKFILN